MSTELDYRVCNLLIVNSLKRSEGESESEVSAKRVLRPPDCHQLFHTCLLQGKVTPICDVFHM
jgi:hypothetical protein